MRKVISITLCVLACLMIGGIAYAAKPVPAGATLTREEVIELAKMSVYRWAPTIIQEYLDSKGITNAGVYVPPTVDGTSFNEAIDSRLDTKGVTTGGTYAPLDNDAVTAAVNARLEALGITSSGAYTAIDTAITNKLDELGVTTEGVYTPVSTTVSEVLEDVGITTDNVYTPPSTGPSVNVVDDYSAAGNGSDDDTTPIQNAINYINSVGGGTVIIPSGTYKITAQLTMKSNVTLSMSPTTILKTASTAGYFYMIYIGNGVNKAAIYGGVLEGAGESAGWDENYNIGINMYESPTNITIKGVEIRYFMCDGMYLGAWITSEGAPNGVLIEGCNIHHCGRNGIAIISQRNVTYKNNVIHDIGLNNTATSTGAGFKFEVNNSGGKNWVGENILLTGNEIYGCHIQGIFMSDYYDRATNNGGVTPYHPVSITIDDTNNCHDNATLGHVSYSYNYNNCLEWATGTTTRWVSWPGCPGGTLHNSTATNGTWAWD